MDMKLYMKTKDLAIVSAWTFGSVLFVSLMWLGVRYSQISLSWLVRMYNNFFVVFVIGPISSCVVILLVPEKLKPIDSKVQ